MPNKKRKEINEDAEFQKMDTMAKNIQDAHFVFSCKLESGRVVLRGRVLSCQSMSFLVVNDQGTQKKIHPDRMGEHSMAGAYAFGVFAV